MSATRSASTPTIRESVASCTQLERDGAGSSMGRAQSARGVAAGSRGGTDDAGVGLGAVRGDVHARDGSQEPIADEDVDRIVEVVGH